MIGGYESVGCVSNFGVARSMQAYIESTMWMNAS
jgi:hypothetical protein